MMGPLAVAAGSFAAAKMLFSGRRKYKSRQALIEVSCGVNGWGVAAVELYSFAFGTNPRGFGCSRVFKAFSTGFLYTLFFCREEGFVVDVGVICSRVVVLLWACV